MPARCGLRHWREDITSCSLRGRWSWAAAWSGDCQHAGAGGHGKLRIVDRDFLELNNLQRQVLYDEEDVAAGLPKAIAAKQRLAKINSEIEIDAIVSDVDHTNIERLLEGVDCLVDGRDNIETRFLLNDAAVKLGIPWVYGGCLGTEGQTITIVPGQTPCLRCLLPSRRRRNRRRLATARAFWRRASAWCGSSKPTKP